MEQLAQRFSYAAPTDPMIRRLAIRGIERATGKAKLMRIYAEQRRDPATGFDFWQAAIRGLELSPAYDEAALARIPATGPLVVVANHPYGVLDGLVLGWLLSRRRPEFRILVHSLLTSVDDIRDFTLPIDFSETPEALRTNLRSRDAAMRVLRQGGCIGVFPGGTVSTSEKPFMQAVDPRWRPFTARLIQSSRATVVPMFFDGQNSRLFQFASQISLTLRLSLLLKEVADKIGKTVPVRIGAPIAYEDLPSFDDRQALTDWLRARTYALGPGRDHGRIMPPMS